MAGTLRIDGGTVRELGDRIATVGAAARPDARALAVDGGALASDAVAAELQRSSALRGLLLTSAADLLEQLAASVHQSADEFDAVDRNLAGGAHGGMVAG